MQIKMNFYCKMGGNEQKMKENGQEMRGKLDRKYSIFEGKDEC